MMFNKAQRVDYLKKERAQLRHARLGKDDFIRAMLSGAQFNAEMAKNSLKRSFKDAHPTAKQLDVLDSGQQREPFSLHPFLLATISTGFPGSLCFYLPEQIEVGIRRIADEIEAEGGFARCKISYEDRCNRISEMDAEIIEAEKEMDEIRAAMVANGQPKADFHVERISYE